MFETLLVATDFSKYADNAVRYAHALAQLNGSKVHVLHVIEPRIVDLEGVAGEYGFRAERDKYLNSLRDDADKQMQQLRLKANSLGLDATTHLREGRAADEIAAFAKEIGAGLIVVATHGRSGFDRVVLGSTFEKLIRESTVPVLAVKDSEHGGAGIGRDGLRISRILCPCDFSESSLRALPYATHLCKQFNATLVLMYVVDSGFENSTTKPGFVAEFTPLLAQRATESLEKVASNLTEIRHEVKVRTGVRHRVLTESVSSESIDLIVMTTHGYGALPRFVLGSVAEKVVRLANCPILTIPPEKKK